MEPFDAYSYFKTIIKEVGINSIKRCSGILQLEEILANPASVKSPLLVVEDNDSGFLELDRGTRDSGYYNIYIMTSVKMNNAEDALKQRNLAKKLTAKLFLKMMEDSDLWKDWGTGLDASRIDYSKIGPIAQNFYGYSVGFQMNIDFSYSLNAD